MPRRQTRPLDRFSAERAYSLRDSLGIGEFVTLHYIKRDGSQSSSTGEVVFFNGQDGMDNMSVTINDAQKGHRTINLAGVLRVLKGNA